MIKFIKNTKIDFVSKFAIANYTSIILIVLGLLLLLGGGKRTRSGTLARLSLALPTAAPSVVAKNNVCGDVWANNMAEVAISVRWGKTGYAPTTYLYTYIYTCSCSKIRN